MECGRKRQADATAYKSLIAYICKLFQIKAPTTMICAQLKKFKDDEHYTYQGMKAALEYFFELQGNSVDGSRGIGIIPYIYDEVRDFYTERKIIQQSMKNTSLEKNDNVKLIHIVQEEDKDFSSFNLIDIEEIGGDDEN